MSDDFKPDYKDEYSQIHNSGNPLPCLSKSIRLLFHIYKLPFGHKIPLLEKTIKSKLGFPPDAKFNQHFYLSSGNIRLGSQVGLADTFILDYAPVFIGNNVSFSYRNMIITSTHDIDNFHNIIVRPVYIGDDVWITTNVTILGGVSVGAGSIIGAGSVVTKNIPAGVFAAGNPCKVIKKIKFNK